MNDLEKLKRDIELGMNESIDDENEVIDDIYWVINTISERESFGLDPLNAALARERRARGVLIDCKGEIRRLQNKIKELSK